MKLPKNDRKYHYDPIRSLIRFEFERVYRTWYWSSDKPKPRYIVANLHSFQDREDVLKKINLPKSRNIFMNGDYCQNTNKNRKDIRKTVWRKEWWKHRIPQLQAAEGEESSRCCNILFLELLDQCWCQRHALREFSPADWCHSSRLRS